MQHGYIIKSNCYVGLKQNSNCNSINIQSEVSTYQNILDFGLIKVWDTHSQLPFDISRTPCHRF